MTIIDSSSRNFLGAQSSGKYSSFSLVDAGVLALIFGIGALHVLLYQRSSDFFFDDAFVADCARSILQHGFYGIDGRIETNQPPGTAGILALVCFLGGCSHAIYLQVMAVFETLGFLACYALLRRQMPRAAAAAICLVLISSPIYFSLATQWVTPCFPYFFATISALFAASKFEEAANTTSRIAWGVLLGALIAASLLIATAAMALLAAIVMTVAVDFLWHRPAGVIRMKKFLAVLLVGMAVQGLWMHRKPAEPEWQLPGYPRPYLEQLKVKNGNYPELGLASPRDIAARVVKNVYEHSYLLSQLLFRRWINPAWMSVVILGPLFLILLGWVNSVRQTGGGLLEWYFVLHEAIYLLWPWNLESRFFLPVAPLACLYLWRGGVALVTLMRGKSRLLGAVWFPVFAILIFLSWFWLDNAWIGKHLARVGFQDEVTFATWLLAVIVAGWMVLANSSWVSFAAAFSNWFTRRIDSLRTSPQRISQLLGALLVIAFIAMGLQMELELARNNLDLKFIATLVTPDVRAGEWVGAHTDTDAVVMARYLPTVYHHSHRKMVWFPPSSDAKLLMDGILRLKVEYVVVAKRKNEYYLPPDVDSFSKLATAYPTAFDLAAHGEDFWVYRVAAHPQ